MLEKLMNLSIEELALLYGMIVVRKENNIMKEGFISKHSQWLNMLEKKLLFEIERRKESTKRSSL